MIVGVCDDAQAVRRSVSSLTMSSCMIKELTRSDEDTSCGGGMLTNDG